MEMRISDVDFVMFAWDIASILDDIDEIGLINDGENGFLDCVFDGFKLSLNCFLQILWFLPEWVEYKHIVFSFKSSFLFQSLNFVDNFSWESFNFELFILSAIKQDDNFVASDCFMLKKVIIVKLFIDE